MRTPHQRTIVKFLLLLAVLAAYFVYLSRTYGIETGGLISVLTWSFFVLCTPVADAGFLLDFPLRVLFGVRMFLSEMIVWAIAISLNVYALTFARAAYSHTTMTSLLERILTTPWPLWSIIAVSALGTFASVYFGDRLMDAHSHHTQQSTRAIVHHILRDIVIYGGLFAVVFYGYKLLLDHLGINITD